jgi:hypothetical protein
MLGNRKCEMTRFGTGNETSKPKKSKVVKPPKLLLRLTP